jgi:HEPN domain-containing protein
MSTVSPESIFQQAARFHVAQTILRERAPDYPPQVLEAPHCVLAAFTIELMLKGLICHERGGAAPRGHDLLALFDQLSARTRERLQTMWTDLARRNRDEFEAVKQETGVTLEPELRLAVAAGKRGFELIRYQHEVIQEGFAFYLGPLADILMKIVFELRPDWGGA